MKSLRFFALAVCAVLTLACFQAIALGQAKDNLANMSGGGAGVRWEVQVANSGVSLTIVAPDGRSFRKDYEAGSSPDFSLADMPDGIYTYELRLRPPASPALKLMMSARAVDDESDAKRNARKRPTLPSLVQSGAFTILNGSVVVPGAVEGQRPSAKATEPRPEPVIKFSNSFARLRNHPTARGVRPDDVIPDDLIVQGSACVGLDCVSGEVFGFDTIRMKENNTRLQFEDTSAAGFPLNNWQIRANSSSAGGASFLAFVDQGAAGNSETGTIVFEVDAGAPANALKVSSNGKVGIRTATPVLDVHMNTSDTPAIRLEQNNSGGFTAQTWDVAGNEANFFVRDVTSGSRLPFRIRPGAPTSSIDISANGNVGIGTASPAQELHVVSADNNSFAAEFEQTNATASNGVFIKTQTTNSGDTALSIVSNNGATQIINARNNGFVGIGTASPTQNLSVNGTAGKTGGGSWDVFSDERLKRINGKFSRGLSAVLRLQPLKYEYKPDNPLGLKSEGQYVGFSAQEVEKVIPEAVNRNGNGYLMVNNDPILWTMLNAIKEQQKQIEELKTQVRKLQATSRRRAR